MPNWLLGPRAEFQLREGGQSQNSQISAEWAEVLTEAASTYPRHRRRAVTRREAGADTALTLGSRRAFDRSLVHLRARFTEDRDDAQRSLGPFRKKKGEEKRSMPVNL